MLLKNNERGKETWALSGRDDDDGGSGGGGGVGGGIGGGGRIDISVALRGGDLEGKRE